MAEGRDAEGWAERVAARAAAWPVTLPAEGARRIGAHLAAVAEASLRLNLTAVRDADDMVVRLALDSLAPVHVGAPGGRAAVDIGSGAGFPGLPLLWAGWADRVTLLEATGKKCAFLRAATADDADRVGVDWARAELRGARAGGAFDVATVRAVGPLPALVELAFGLLAPRGVMWAWKGPEVAEEIADADRAAAALGGERCATYRYTLPALAGDRTLVAYRRGRGDLPAGYPRAPAVARRRPIGR